MTDTVPAVNDIKHTRTQVKSPQANGIGERFHKTILQKFCQVTFRKTIYTDLESLYRELDAWLEYYNDERSRSSRARLYFKPPAYPVSFPLAPITLWQGITIAIGLRALEPPTARTALGLLIARAISW